MRVVFMGSGEFACPSLAALLESQAAEVVAVVSQPDRPRGRHLLATPCPVRALAIQKGIRTLTPERVGAPESVDDLRSLAPDLIVTAAYGQYVPKSILEIPKQGAVNVHPSLLPKYRGAAPVQWAVARGETETGVTLFFMSEKMDAGDIIIQESVPIGPEDTAATLSPRLAELGAALVLKALDFFVRGDVPRIPQDHARATLAPKLKKEDGRVRWAEPAEVLRNKVRGFQPWPGCFCEVPAGSGHFLRIHRARVEPGRGQPGCVLDATGDGPLIATGVAALRLLEVQPEGRKAMSGDAYLRGHRTRVGDLWG